MGQNIWIVTISLFLKFDLFVDIFRWNGFPQLKSHLSIFCALSNRFCDWFSFIFKYSICFLITSWQSRFHLAYPSNVGQILRGQMRTVWNSTVSTYSFQNYQINLPPHISSCVSCWSCCIWRLFGLWYHPECNLQTHSHSSLPHHRNLHH